MLVVVLHLIDLCRIQWFKYLISYTRWNIYRVQFAKVMQSLFLDTELGDRMSTNWTKVHFTLREWQIRAKRSMSVNIYWEQIMKWRYCLRNAYLLSLVKRIEHSEFCFSDQMRSVDIIPNVMFMVDITMRLWMRKDRFVRSGSCNEDPLSMLVKTLFECDRQSCQSDSGEIKQNTTNHHEPI